MSATGDAQRGRELFTRQSCIACHTTADGQLPKGPHLVDIGKRYKPDELIESILKPSAKLAQGFETIGIVTVEGKVHSGFVTSESADAIDLRLANGLPLTIRRDDIDEEYPQKISAMPEGIAGNLTPEELADLLAYLQSLKSGE